MTNFERYIDGISRVIAVDEATKEITFCHDIPCEYCLFGVYDKCGEAVKAWLNMEYKGPVVITPQEKVLLDMMADDTEIRTIERKDESKTGRIGIRSEHYYVNLELAMFKGLVFDWLDGDYHEVSEFRNAKVRDSGE